MGTFTKSFGGMGGYISSSKEICDHLRQQCPAYVYHNTLSPVVAQQVGYNINTYLKCGVQHTHIYNNKHDYVCNYAFIASY
jgi:7-keto-8-aminopelargonate synthetase-like enzyme